MPEAWENAPDTVVSKELRGFYEWSSFLQEPWDGPALVSFADGRYIGARLDRNGLRPARYYIMDDDTVMLASEVGVVDIDDHTILEKGRLEGGSMIMIDTREGKVLKDAELKQEFATPWEAKRGGGSAHSQRSDAKECTLGVFSITERVGARSRGLCIQCNNIIRVPVNPPPPPPPC